MLIAGAITCAAPVPATTAPPPPPAVNSKHQALQPLAQLIALGESLTVGDYNAANAGKAMDLGSHGLSTFFGRDCSEVSIGEVMRAQARGHLHAVGRYQLIGTTLQAAIAWAGLSRADRFTPANQDRLFRALIQHKRPAVWAFLTGEGSLAAAANAMAREWSSMPMPCGGSFYGGGDRAHVSRARLLSALRQTRAVIRGLT